MDFDGVTTLGATKIDLAGLKTGWYYESRGDRRWSVMRFGLSSGRIIASIGLNDGVLRPNVVEPSGEQRHAMLLSVMVGLLMLGGKTSAYLWTNSAAILSDAAESVIHVLALSFAAYSLWLSSRSGKRALPLWVRPHCVLLRRV